MVNTSLINTVFLLAGSAAARPRWWAYHGPGPNARVAQGASQSQAAPVHTIPSGGFVSNGVLYMTTTITVPAGQVPPATTTQPVATPQAQPASAGVLPPDSQSSSVVAPAKPIASSASEATGATGSITEEQILAIVPESQSCSGAAKPEQCATAAQAGPALNAAFAKYGINTAGAQAAVVALEAFESANFKFNTNQVPGRVGQGTRNMMMPDYVTKYATAIKGADKVQAAGGDPAAILALVNGNDEDSFGSGAWFLSTQCPQFIQQLGSAPDTAWDEYMTSCVGVSADDAGRNALWNKAKAAFSVS